MSSGVTIEHERALAAYRAARKALREARGTVAVEAALRELAIADRRVRRALLPDSQHRIPAAA